MKTLFNVDSVNTNSLLAVIEAVSKKHHMLALTGVYFKANKEANTLEVVATNSTIMNKVVINNALFDESFNNLVIDSESLKQALNKYKNMNISLRIDKEDNDDYFLLIGSDKYLIKVIKNEYPNIDNIKVFNDENDCHITLSVDVLERLLKTLKTSKKDFVKFTFKNTLNKPFKATIGDDINIIACPCKE